MLIKEIKELVPFFKIASWAEKAKLFKAINDKKNHVAIINKSEIGLSYGNQEIEILEKYHKELCDFEIFFNAKIEGKGKKNVQIYSQKFEEERLKFLDLNRFLYFLDKKPICFDNNKSFLLKSLEGFMKKLDNLIEIFPVKVKAREKYFESISHIPIRPKPKDMAPNQFVYIEYVPPNKRPKPRNWLEELHDAKNKVLNLIVTLREISNNTFNFIDYQLYFSKMRVLQSLTRTLDLEINGNYWEVF